VEILCRHRKKLWYEVIMMNIGGSAAVWEGVVWPPVSNDEEV
jgi:hypothetical protein